MALTTPFKTAVVPVTEVAASVVADGGKGMATRLRVCSALWPPAINMKLSPAASELVLTATGTLLCVVLLLPSWPLML